MVNFTLVLQIGMLFLGLFLFLNLFEMKLFKMVSTMAPETVKSPNVCVCGRISGATSAKILI